MVGDREAFHGGWRLVEKWRGYTAASVVNSAADVRDNSLMVRPEY